MPITQLVRPVKTPAQVALYEAQVAAGTIQQAKAHLNGLLEKAEPVLANMEAKVDGLDGRDIEEGDRVIEKLRAFLAIDLSPERSVTVPTSVSERVIG